MRSDSSERDRMPYIQIDIDRWVCMRESKEVPVAVIERIDDNDGGRIFLVRQWHPLAHQRRLLGGYDTLADANRSVRWDTSRHRTGREDHRPPADQGEAGIFNLGT